MPDDRAGDRAGALLEQATRRLVRTVDALTDEQWVEPSLLPGWSRAHVVAHLTLNAEGLAAALAGVHEGLRTPMYASQESRDADIAALGAQPPAEVRDRFLASTTMIAGAIAGLADHLGDATFPRVPGSTASVRAAGVADMRVREVEIHHVDLGVDYAASDWSDDFVTLLLDARSGLYTGPTSFTVHADDLDRRWPFTGSGGHQGGSAGPTVSGPALALAWWATGRGSGEGLTSDDGTVPQIGAW